MKLWRLLALASAMLVLPGCTHLGQLGVQRQIGPLQRGDVQLIRTSPKAGQVYALTLPGVTGTFAELGSDGSCKYVFDLKDGSVVSIFHGPTPPPVAIDGQRLSAVFVGKPATWTIEPRHTGSLAMTTVPDGNAAWQVSLTARGKTSVRELVAHLATMSSVRLAWPDPVVTPPTSHVNHMLLRGRVHCPPGRNAGRGAR